MMKGRGQLKKTIKRLVGLVLSMAMVFTATSSAFAATAEEPAETASAVNQVADAATIDLSDRALGKILATGSTTINGGTGILRVTLPSSHSNVYLLSQIGYQDKNVPIVCTVRDPDGDLHNLGTIIGNGSTTSAYHLSYAPAGTYSFYFSTALDTPYIVMSYIRE